MEKIAIRIYLISGYMAKILKLSLFAMERQAFQIEKPSFLIEILNLISKNQVFNFES